MQCGACEWECPHDAIYPGAARPLVDENLCTECYGVFGESQCIVVCPADAIIVFKQEPVEELLQRFQRIYANRSAQNTWIWQRIGL